MSQTERCPEMQVNMNEYMACKPFRTSRSKMVRGPCNTSNPKKHTQVKQKQTNSPSPKTNTQETLMLLLGHWGTSSLWLYRQFEITTTLIALIFINGRLPTTSRQPQKNSELNKPSTVHQPCHRVPIMSVPHQTLLTPKRLLHRKSPNAPAAARRGVWWLAVELWGLIINLLNHLKKKKHNNLKKQHETTHKLAL